MLVVTGDDPSHDFRTWETLSSPAPPPAILTNSQYSNWWHSNPAHQSPELAHAVTVTYKVLLYHNSANFNFLIRYLILRFKKTISELRKFPLKSGTQTFDTFKTIDMAKIKNIIGSEKFTGRKQKCFFFVCVSFADVFLAMQSYESALLV